MDFIPLSCRPGKTKRLSTSISSKNQYCQEEYFNMNSKNPNYDQGNENSPKEMTRKPSFESKLKERIRRHYKNNQSKVSLDVRAYLL